MASISFSASADETTELVCEQVLTRPLEAVTQVLLDHEPPVSLSAAAVPS